jgi:ElaB/YqjD/DUF883 family membrane-anchored ribosome-binding protein
MTIQSGTPSGSQSERNGNGSMGGSTPSGAMGGAPMGTSAPGGSSSSGLPLSGSTGGPTGAGTFPDGGSSRGGYRPDEGHRSEFGAFLDDLSELARGSGQGDLRDELERRVSQARGRMSAALDQGMEMSARARDQMQRGIEYSRDAVVERPLSALSLAAIGGLLVGLLLSRRD